jgi:predicted ATPase
MLHELKLRNFKCFEATTVPLGSLTLLSGLNGMGKSSVIQSLLLLRQSWEQGILQAGQLALNGDLTQLGTAQDALFSYAEEERIGFELAFRDAPPLGWQFSYEKKADVLKALGATPTAEELQRHALFGDGFQYLCAERIGPRPSFATSDHTVRHLRQVGTRGEFATHFLSVFGKQKLALPRLRHPKAVGDELGYQVEAWLAEISPGTRLKLTSHAAMDLVQLQYQFVAGSDVSDAYRATNVGFGLTYLLPVLVATLGARPGSLLLLENPEAHLHPRGQRRMGEFLAQAAASGIQVLVETHSDHLLNGIRVAVHGGKVNPELVRLHFFERPQDDSGPAHRVISPSLDRNGRISQWPSGFFDEWDVALDALLAPAKV